LSISKKAKKKRGKNQIGNGEMGEFYKYRKNKKKEKMGKASLICPESYKGGKSENGWAVIEVMIRVW
jgi:hypothetical protein